MPDINRRWQLKPYDYSILELCFAGKFIDWNSLEYGVQSIDACLTLQGGLLPAELEELNPYLSLIEISQVLRQTHVNNFTQSLNLVIDRYFR